MAKADFAKFLKSNAGMLKAAAERPDTEFPDGEYIFKLKNVRFNEGERPALFWTWLFTEGEFKGQEFVDRTGVGTEDQLFFTMKHIGRLGFEDVYDTPDKMSALIDSLNSSGLVIRGKLASRDTASGVFQNLRVGRVLESGEDAGGEDDAEAEQEPATRKKKAAAPAEEPEAEEAEEEAEAEEEDEATLQVGMRVMATIKGDEAEAEVLSIDEETGLVRVKLDDGKVWRVQAEKLTLITAEEEEEGEEEGEEEEEEEAPAPVRRVTKTTPKKK